MKKIVFLLLIFVSLFGKTPSEEIYSRLLNKTPFDVYVQYFVNYKAGGNVDLVKKMIVSKTKNIGYYQGIVKALYFAYKYHGNGRFSQKYIDFFTEKVPFEIYDREHDMVSNSYEAIFIQDLLIRHGKFLEAYSLFSTPQQCFLFSSYADRAACLANMAYLSCVLSKKEHLGIFADSFSFQEALDVAYEFCKKKGE